MVLEEEMVFISYKSEEYEIAKSIRALLQEHSYPCWMAPESIPAGSNYMLEIPKAIRTCDLFVLIISEASQKSQWVQKEIDRAVKFNKYILPFHADDSELSDAIDFVVSNNQRIEAYQNFDGACKELLTAVRMLHPAVQAPKSKPAPAKPAAPEKVTPAPAPAPAPTPAQAPTQAPVTPAATPTASPELSQEMLLQLLGNLPPEYIGKLIPGYQAPAAPVTAEAPKPEAEAAAPVVAESKPEPQPEPKPEPEVVPAPVAEEPQPAPVSAPEPKTAPTPAVAEPVVTPAEKEPAPAATVTKQINHVKVTSVSKPTIAVQKPTITGSAKPTFVASRTTPPIQTAAASKVQPVNSDENTTQTAMQRVTQQVMAQEMRTAYERNFEQSNARGFRITLSVLTGYKSSRKEDGVVVIPYGVKEIADNVFAKCKSLHCVVIPPTVNKIGANAFLDCINLEKIIFHEGVTRIDNNAFQGCRMLKKIELPKSVTYIGAFAFAGCTNASLSVPADVDFIGSAAFNSCIDVTIDAQNTIYLVHSGCIVDKSIHSVISSTSDAKIPSLISVKAIGDYAFENCFSLYQITLPDHIERIGVGSFRSCLNLTEVNMGNGVESIGRQAFAGCGSLHTLNMKFGVGLIDHQAFSQCRSLKNVTIPKSVRYCAKDAFEGCPRIKIVD